MSEIQGIYLWTVGLQEIKKKVSPDVWSGDKSSNIIHVSPDSAILAMIQAIYTIEDVRTFFQQLLEESLNFHPDEDFANYINCETSEDTYTPEEAEQRNRLMQAAFEVCEKNKICIYEFGNYMALKYTGLDRLFCK